MRPDIQRDLIPPDDALRLVGALNAMQATFHDRAQQWQLLDESGHVPTEPLSYTELLRHATSAQDLSRDVLRLTSEFAASDYSTTRTGRAILAHLATASTMSAHAPSHFAQTAQGVLGQPRSACPTKRYVTDPMVIDHASARAFLQRTSESLRDAAKALDDHLDFQRLISTLARLETPVPPPPGLKGRHA